MRATVFTLMVAAILAVGSQACADTFCDALGSVAAKSDDGFAALRGVHDARAPSPFTRPFDLYTAKIVLPGTTACRVVVPHGAGFGPPSFDCDVTSANPPPPRMTRLVLDIARCVGAHVANLPPFETDADGPRLDFTAGQLNYSVSAAKIGAGVWDIDLSIAPPSP